MSESQKPWTLLSNHCHVLIALVRNPEARMREVAAQVGITERAVQGIVHDLEIAGFLTKSKMGRRNTYEFKRKTPLRHNLEADHCIGELLDLFV
jgi:DNA-binding MarR family transcriptional regulator